MRDDVGLVIRLTLNSRSHSDTFRFPSLIERHPLLVSHNHKTNVYIPESTSTASLILVPDPSAFPLFKLCIFVLSMGVCNHVPWLSLHGEDQILLQQTSILKDIVASLEKPAQKWPSLVVLIGCSSDTSLMSDMLPTSRTRGSCKALNAVHLHLDSQTAFSDHPILIAHGNIPERVSLNPEPCVAPHYSTTIHELSQQEPSPNEALNALYSRLLHPFAEVVCLFATDRDGVHGIAKRLELWFKPELVGTSMLTTRPRLLVVSATNEYRGPEVVQTELFEILGNQSAHSYTDYFSCISVYVQQSSTQTLKDRIRSEANIIRNERAQHHTLYNAIHFDHFFDYACEHFASAKTEPFDFIASSRLHRPISTNLTAYVTDLLAHLESSEKFYDFGAPLLAESFVLDNYTYETHRWFSLCRKRCSTANKH
jgi:hypothetical protein